jgi:hypothetical protein
VNLNTDHICIEPEPGQHPNASDRTLRWLSANEANFRHGGWQTKRAKIHRAMCAAGVGEKVIERFEQCGMNARYAWSEKNAKWVVVASYCRSRFCEPCARAKQMTIALNLRRQLSARPIGRYRFTTLTIAHTEDPLPDQLRKLLTCWKRLKKTKAWRTQAGGAYFLECKIGDDGLWHPHLHVVSEGYFLPMRELSGLWSQLTGGSYVVDVRAVHNLDDVCFELTKYVTKGTSSDVWEDHDRAIEWICASRGVRLCGTFGSWRKFKLTAKLDQDKNLIFVGTLTQVHDGAARGITKYKLILWCVQNSRPPPLELVDFVRNPDQDQPCTNQPNTQTRSTPNSQHSSEAREPTTLRNVLESIDPLFNASSLKARTQAPSCSTQWPGHSAE